MAQQPCDIVFVAACPRRDVDVPEEEIAEAQGLAQSGLRHLQGGLDLAFLGHQAVGTLGWYWYRERCHWCYGGDGGGGGGFWCVFRENNKVKG